MRVVVHEKGLERHEVVERALRRQRAEGHGVRRRGEAEEAGRLLNQHAQVRSGGGVFRMRQLVRLVLLAQRVGALSALSHFTTAFIGFIRR